MKRLCFAGKEISYCPMEMLKVRSYITESTKCYRPPRSLLTLAFSEPHNTRILCSTYRTLNNNSFPAVFDGIKKYGTNLHEYMESILKCTLKTSTREIQLPGDCEHSRRTCIYNNPVACVIERKTVINDVCLSQYTSGSLFSIL